MNTRLKEIRKYLNLTQKEFSEILRTGQSTYCMMENGQRTIGGKIIKLVCEIYNVNEEWLLTGEGEMLKPSTDILGELKEQYDLSEIDLTIIKNYLNMKKADREIFTSYLLQLTEKKENKIIPLAADTSEIE